MGNIPEYQLHVVEDSYAFQYILNISILWKIWFLEISQKNDLFWFFEDIIYRKFGIEVPGGIE